MIFYVDDLHLAPDSLVRTRKALTEFIDRGMSENDQVAITSSSGQIGFLQQFSNDRVALRSAVARLNYRTSTKLDMDSPPMSEYIAMKIRDGDEATLSYYITELQKQNCFRSQGELICTMSPQAMKMAVRERAQEMVTMASPATDNTLIMLENLMRMAAQLPGRKDRLHGFGRVLSQRSQDRFDEPHQENHRCRRTRRGGNQHARRARDHQ